MARSPVGRQTSGHGELDGGRIATGLLGATDDLPPARRDLVDVTRHRVPAVAEPHDAVESRLPAADPERGGALDRLRLAIETASSW